KNISLKSDEKYLLYWMYNGKGNFDKSLDLAKTLDDPQLIMYGLVKQIESLKNNPDLSGEERDQKLKTYEQQLDEYKKKYGNSSNDKNLSDTEKKE
ncbi:type VII secretion protein EssB/YukC, partial [Bacillus cereus]|nr:type VII secretion protein EssB/YukC [Bacillus cereus]